MGPPAFSNGLLNITVFTNDTAIVLSTGRLKWVVGVPACLLSLTLRPKNVIKLNR